MSINVKDLEVQLSNTSDDDPDYPALKVNPFTRTRVDGGGFNDPDSTKNANRYRNITVIRKFFEYGTLTIDGTDKNTVVKDLYENTYFSSTYIAQTLKYIFKDFIPNVVNQKQKANSELADIVLRYDPVFRFAAISNQIDKYRNDSSERNTQIESALNQYEQYNDKDASIQKIENAILESDSSITDEIYKPVYDLIDLYKYRKNNADTILTKRLMALGEIHFEFLFFYSVLLSISTPDFNSNNISGASDFEDEDENNVLNQLATGSYIGTAFNSDTINSDNYSNYNSGDTKYKEVANTHHAIKVVVDILNAERRRLKYDEWAIAYLRSETEKISNQISDYKDDIDKQKNTMNRESHSMTSINDKNFEKRSKLRSSIVMFIVYIVLVILFITAHVMYFKVFSENGSMKENKYLQNIAKTPYARSNILLITNLVVLTLILLSRIYTMIHRRQIREGNN